MKKKKIRVIHMSSVHPPFDNRIFYKECSTLAKSGYEVFFVVPHDRDVVVNDVKIVQVPKPKHRLERMTRTVWHVYQRAIALQGDIYHFHDPELLLPSLLLRKKGKQVIYDVHEDYSSSIRMRNYLPRITRQPVAKLFGALQKISTKFFHIILAEKCYEDCFPDAVKVLNYPLRSYFSTSDNFVNKMANKPRLLYTGVVSVARGALFHTKILDLMEDIEVYIIGRCPVELAKRMRENAGKGSDRLFIVGEGRFIPYDQILNYYREGGWTAGLVLFQAIRVNMEKELTKFFEYMGAGIPIICSDFPVWRKLMEETKAGICVDPHDNSAIIHAIHYLRDNPDIAKRMGENGREAVARRYNWEFESKKLQKFYNDVAQGV